MPLQLPAAVEVDGASTGRYLDLDGTGDYASSSGVTSGTLGWIGGDGVTSPYTQTTGGINMNTATTSVRFEALIRFANYTQSDAIMYTLDQHASVFQVEPGERLQFFLDDSAGTILSAQSVESLYSQSGIAAGDAVWVAAQYDAADGETYYYWSNDTNILHPDNVSWNGFASNGSNAGTPLASGSGAFASNATYRVSSSGTKGQIFVARWLYDGATVEHVNFSDDASEGDISFTSTYGSSFTTTGGDVEFGSGSLDIMVLSEPDSWSAAESGLTSQWGSYIDAVLQDNPFAFYLLDESTFSGENLGYATYNISGVPVLEGAAALPELVDSHTFTDAIPVFPDNANMNTSDIAALTVSMVAVIDDQSTLQCLWEQGGGTNGFSISIEAGEFFCRAWANGTGVESDQWGYGSSAGDVYTSLPITGSAGDAYYICGIFERDSGAEAYDGTISLYVGNITQGTALASDVYNGSGSSSSGGVGFLLAHSGDMGLGYAPDAAILGDTPGTDADPAVASGNVNAWGYWSGVALTPIQVQAHFDAASDERSWGFSRTAAGEIRIRLVQHTHIDAHRYSTLTSSGASLTGTEWTRVTYDWGTGDVGFYSSTDAVATPYSSVSWSSVSTGSAAAGSPLRKSDIDALVGGFFGGDGYSAVEHTGKVYSATVLGLTSNTGSSFEILNADFRSFTQFYASTGPGVDSASNVWAFAGDAVLFGIGTFLTDHGRAPIETAREGRFVEVMLANGKINKYWKGNSKATFSIAWEWLPSSNSATVDGFTGRDSLSALFKDSQTTHTLIFLDEQGDWESYTVRVEEYSETVKRRSEAEYFWDVSLSLKEM